MCQFTVRYGPHAQIAMSDAVLIKSNDPKNPVITVPLTGTGVAGTIKVCQLVPGMNGAAPTVNTATCIPGVTPVPTLAFGSLQPGGSFIREVRIFNDGLFELAINQASVQGMVPDFAVVGGNDYSGVIEPGATVDLQVKYTAETQGSNTANLVIPSTDPVNPVLTIPITGSELGPKLCINPTSLDFGTIPVATTRTLSVTLTNCGEADYDLTQLELINNNSAATVFTSPAAGAAGAIPAIPYTFPVGATLTLNVTYEPTVEETPPAAGDSGFFSIITGITGTSYQRATVPITGRGGFPGCNSTSGRDEPDPHRRDPGLAGNHRREPGHVHVQPAQPGLARRERRRPRRQRGDRDVLFLAARLPARRQCHQPDRDRREGGPLYGGHRRLRRGARREHERDVPERACPGDSRRQLVRRCPRPAHLAAALWRRRPPLHRTGRKALRNRALTRVIGLDVFAGVSLWARDPDANCAGAGSCANLSPDWGKNNLVEPDGTHADDASLDIDQRWGSGPENVTQPMPFDGTYRSPSTTTARRTSPAWATRLLTETSPRS